jgi:hypothetical protein
MILEIYIKSKILVMMTFHPNHICVVTCCTSFGLAQRRSVESKEVFHDYNFCIASYSINEKNESLQYLLVLVIQ